MEDFPDYLANSDELCIKALNSLARPPEIDEPFLDFFKPKPKLRIKSKTRGKSLDSSDIGRASTSVLGEEQTEADSSVFRKSLSTSREELNSFEESNDLGSARREFGSTRRVRSEAGRQSRSGGYVKSENLLSSILILPDKSGKKSTPNTEARKRKLNSNFNIKSSISDEFLSVATPISPYVISPKSNNFNYSNTNVHNQDLTEKNIDLLNSLIEIKDKELSNLSTTYSYEKSELKLEINRLQKIIKDSEESHLLLKKEILDKDEALAESARSYEKLELEYSSTKQSLEIMLEAERNANQHLRQELREKTINDSGLSYLGENSIVELQSYKLKYFEAMRRLQRLETEMVLNRTKNMVYEDRELEKNDSIPIFVGSSGDVQSFSEYIPQSMQTCLEICLNIREDNVEVSSNSEVIQLVSENSLLKESLMKLREELEIEKNKSIVASIRHLTQRPILISSCTSTRLSMDEIEAIEAKAICYEQKYEGVRFTIDKNIVNTQIVPSMNFLRNQKIINIEIQEFQNIISKSEKSIQTHVDENVCMHVNTGINTNILHDVGREVEVNSQIIDDEEKIQGEMNLYDLAFQDYNFVPKLLNNYGSDARAHTDSLMDDENDFKEVKNESGTENLNSKFIEADSSRMYLIGRKSEFLRNVLQELRFEVLELREIVTRLIGEPQHLMDMIDYLVGGNGRKSVVSSYEFNRGDTLIGIIMSAISKVYSMYLEKVDQVEGLLMKEKEWRSYSDRLEAELNNYSLEKSGLVSDISYLKKLLDEKIEKENNSITVKNSGGETNVQRHNGNDEVMSCYTFGESSSINLENDLEWAIDDINITKLISSRDHFGETSFKPSTSELEIVEETKTITQVKNESDRFNKIIKLQGRIKSFKQNRIKLQSAEKEEAIASIQPDNSLIPFKKSVFQDSCEIKSLQENIELEENGSLIFCSSPPQLGGSGDVVGIRELEGMTGTAMMLRLYRYYKQTKLLEKQVTQLSKEKQKLELEYEKDAQTNQMSILSSKLIIEARDMEIKTLKEKCEFLSNKVEDDIKNIKYAAREEIEKVWKPKVEEISSKCEDYQFKISSLESEILILRQQLAFQKQLNSKESKKNEYRSFIKSESYRRSPSELMKKILKGTNSFELKMSTEHENENISDQSDSFIENDPANINSLVDNKSEESDDQNISSLKSALSKLKTISNEYRSFN
ncbi:hypothetical protein OIY81_1756 [Cryptosporidium canis]|nr:hypothetical protein OIY81_1756 [Cryptosporidium canis]